MENKYKELINKLKHLTLTKKLAWQETSSINEYIIEFKDASFIISLTNSGTITFDMIENNVRKTLIKATTGSNEMLILGDLFAEVQRYIAHETNILSKVMIELSQIDNQ